MKQIDKVKNAMLSVQRMSWEQGVSMQALLEAGESDTVVAMAHEAVLKQVSDGRMAIAGDNVAISDPASNGEAVLRAFEMTDDEMYKNAADKMLEYYMIYAPHTEDGVIYHNSVSFNEKFSPKQIWADSCYMVPPFLAVMGEPIEAVKQLVGYMFYLRDDETGLLFHIYDAEKKEFVRRKLWATGNGWALLGIARVVDETEKQGDTESAEVLKETGIAILDAMLELQDKSGLFHDILDDKESFLDGASAMAVATFIYRAIHSKWLDKKYKKTADNIRKVMKTKVDDYGIVHGVCGSPSFDKEGTSCEAQAFFIMMETWADKLN